MLAVVIILASGFSQAQYTTSEKGHSFANSLVFTVTGGANISQTDYLNMQPGTGFGGAFEYFFPTSRPFSFGIGVFGRKEALSGEDRYKKPKSFSTDLLQFGAGVSFNYSAGELFFPYTSLGISAASIKGTSSNNPSGKRNQSLIVPGIDIEAGIKVPLTRSLILSLNTGYHYFISDEMDNYQIGKYNDFYLSGTAGISYSISLGRKYRKVMPESPPIRRRPEKDSVIAARQTETQPGKPLSSAVTGRDTAVVLLTDENKGSITGGGLKQDTSLRKDAGLRQDTIGSITALTEPPSERKSDINSREKVIKEKPSEIPPLRTAETRNNTPARKSGSDNTDSRKNSAEKPAARITVAEKPAAEKSSRVTAPVKKKEEVKEKPAATETAAKKFRQKEILLHGELTFVRDDVQLQPEAYSRLDEVAKTIKQNPGTKWVIESYTDDQGNPSDLKNFSLRRARAVLRYLESQGIPASQLQAEGMGSKDPVEDNKNVWGRMMNRRIIIKRIN